MSKIAGKYYATMTMNSMKRGFAMTSSIGFDNLIVMIDLSLAEFSRTRCLVCAGGNLARVEGTLPAVPPILLYHLYENLL